MFLYLKAKILEKNDTVWIVFRIGLVRFGKLFPMK